MNKMDAFVDVYDDHIETVGAGIMFHRYWVTDAGIMEGYEYPCVMVRLIIEIKELQDLGYKVIVRDYRKETE